MILFQSNINQELLGHLLAKHSVECVVSGHGFPPFIGATRICLFLDFVPFPQLTLHGSHSLHDEILQFTRNNIDYTINIDGR